MKRFEKVLLACDMDGTLLNHDRQISKENEQAILHFTEQGGMFSLATGRAMPAIEPYLPQLHLNAPFSLLNGSAIYDSELRLIKAYGMPTETIALIANILLNYSQIGCEIFTVSEILILRHSMVTDYHMNVLHLPYRDVQLSELLSTENWCQINFTGDRAIVQQLDHYIQQRYPAFHPSSSIAEFCEITPRLINKGQALEFIMKQCAVKRERVFAVGDSENDRQMLTQFQSFIPNNASSKMKQINAVAVRDNDHHAVADAIQKIEQMI